MHFSSCSFSNINTGIFRLVVKITQFFDVIIIKEFSLFEQTNTKNVFFRQFSFYNAVGFIFTFE